MEIQFMSTSYRKSHSFQRAKTIPQWANSHEKGIAIYFKAKVNYCGFGIHGQQNDMKSVIPHQKLFVTKSDEAAEESMDNSINGSEKKGTVIGAVALIIGTSVGSGILALPKKTSPAGFIPSAIAIVFCWGFLLFEALLLAEINVGLRKKRERGEEEEVEIISIRTMAQQTLGEWGGTLATVNYIFLAYTSMVAYTSKSGELLSHLINLPASISGVFFITLPTILISVGGIHLTDLVNRWLTASMIGLLVAIEVIAALNGGWSGLTSSGDWDQVPVTIPVIIFSLVYHDLAPVICTYLGGDLARIRLSLVLGSLVPLLALLVWEAVALGLSSRTNGVDPLDLLLRVRWDGVSTMVQAFSLLAVGTSMIGTLLGFFQFFEEQLSNLFSISSSTQILQPEKSSALKRNEGGFFDMGKWWRSNKINFMATSIAIAPPLLVSITVPDAFSAATDISGGYCMTILYGVLPPAMAWAMQARGGGDENSGNALFGAKPALVGVGLFACGIVMEQILQDLSMLHP
ncbi:uncharacterized protein LOC143890054 isoform X2 [Tasmannia lanceolata]|uniref:uncharacterized protein LOC143890054 isoform X2 n=1 Tax=Tasmannia lanceolata TaxID=3420 RepID=UPI004063D8FD